MPNTLEDQEVQSYLGFTNDRNFNISTDISEKYHFYAPSCLRASKRSSNSATRLRPASACAMFSPVRRKSCSSPTVPLISSKTPTTGKGCHKKNSSSAKKISSTARTPKTPKDSDRFIPPRGSMNFSLSHHKIMKNVVNNENDVSSPSNQPAVEFEKGMTENIDGLFQECSSNTKVIQYQSKASGTPKKAYTLVGYDCASEKSNKRRLRKIPTVPERVLDAPFYLDDYYLNLLDWSVSIDMVAVALDNSAYIWNPSNGEINNLCEFDEREYIASVRWVERGERIALGLSSGCVELWDVEKKKKLRQMNGHAGRIGSLSWNSYILTSGSRSGEIHNHDVRIAQHHVSSFSHHSQEVCGLQWSPTGRYLASGANSNDVVIWDWNQVGQRNGNFVHQFDLHSAAVKALAWCPWQHHILATGGGAADKTIRFWNVNSGNCLNSIATESQVSSLLWNESYKEIVSGHGYPNNQLTIWQYPKMSKKADLTGHTNRILQMVQSPDQTKVMSAAGDETLRLWHCFERKTHGISKKLKVNETRTLKLLTSIR